MKIQYRLSTFITMTLAAAILLYMNLFPGLKDHSATDEVSIYCEWRGWPLSVVWREKVIKQENPRGWSPKPVGAIAILPDTQKIVLAVAIDTAFAIAVLYIILLVLESKRKREEEQLSRGAKRFRLAVAALVLVLIAILFAESFAFTQYDLVYYDP
jgi:hypothetical protein